MLGATLLCFAVAAQLVASFEGRACPGADCGRRPDRYPEALAWVAKHAFFQFPGPATVQSQVLGASLSVLTPVMVACVVLAMRQRIRYRRARRDLMYQDIGLITAKPVVAILVVNETEGRAVEDAFVARTPGLVPESGKAGAKAVTRLGTLGGADIVLAQSEQGTVGAGSMPWTVDNLIRHLHPTVLVLTGICYGLRSRATDGGDQQIGDVVVATQLRAVEHRKVTTRADGSPYEITRGPRPEAASDLLSHARVLGRARTPAVHFGPVLSLNTLVNSRDERARLRALDEEAEAGEMEAAGLYAAAEQARRPWIIVKGISDWGVGKTDEDQAVAARHAADFVADLIAQIEPGADPGPR
jgi:nucleoside phosphorylase